MKIQARLRNFNPVRKAIKAMERRARNLRPALQAVRKPFNAEQHQHFKDESGPDGKWPRRAAPSERRSLRKRQKDAAEKGRKNRPRKPGKPLGKLRQFKVKVGRRSLLARSPVPWSGVHQHGGKVGRGAKIPARPFLWVKPQWVNRWVVPSILRHALGGR